MKEMLKKVLFDKHILVADGEGKNQVEVVYSLRNKLNIRVTSGFELASPEMIEFAADQLGIYVPAPFYRGFPQSVRELTPDVLLLDKLIHYTMTYGFGGFSTVGHSLFETVLERSEFAEEDEPKEFKIITEYEAERMLHELVMNMLNSSRPLNKQQMDTVIETLNEYRWRVRNIASKATAVQLLYEIKDIRLLRFIDLQDVIKLVEYINYSVYGNEKINKLHLKNQDRKFITLVLDEMLGAATLDEVKVCIEKRDAWKGILHHIHYCPKNEHAKAVISALYNKDIKSAYHFFEKCMNGGFTGQFTAKYLKENKGNGALLRNLNYILANKPDVDAVLNELEETNPLAIIQLQNMYRTYNEGERMFTYVKNGRVHTHREEYRKTVLPKEVRDKAVSALEMKLKASLAGKVGKVYIAPGMEKIAVPINMSSGESGFGIMPTGSRITLPEGKKIRAFTYWEKVNDIDISCFGFNADGSRVEFSWRTMGRGYSMNDMAVTFSGDETSGFNGGSEYFDIDIDAVKAEYPKMKYMVFCNNVYSGKDFSEVVCRAGWMSRDILDSGEIYEPKTVRSAYTINAKSTFCYLYAIDVEKREVIWLNIADADRRIVAGNSQLEWLEKYFNACESMNMRKLFEYAGEVVSAPEAADLVVGDISTDKEQIHSYEFEKALRYIAG